MGVEDWWREEVLEEREVDIGMRGAPWIAAGEGTVLLCNGQ